MPEVILCRIEKQRAGALPINGSTQTLASHAKPSSTGKESLRGFDKTVSTNAACTMACITLFASDNIYGEI